MTEMAKLDTPTTLQSPATSEHLVIDLGKQKGKKVKALRKGGGELMADVEECIQGLRSDGKIAAGAQTVIVVVERKRKRGAFPLLNL
jgi:hypothetical protein